MISGGSILRTLCARDVPSALQLSTEAGWNQTAEDWQMLIELAPRSCLAIESEGELASTATLVCYGRQLAWIGMVLTRIAYRGRGFARRLLMETLKLADQMHIESVKLDATDQGQPLYEKLGFRSEQPVERWAWSGSAEVSVQPRPPEVDLLHHWRTADRRAFGVDRSALLERLAGRSSPFSVRQSYVLTRAGRLTSYLGPCVADTPETARSLIERALHSPRPGGWSWDLLPENADAVALASDLGFLPKRHLLRMVRGKDPGGADALIYAIAGFELG